MKLRDITDNHALQVKTFEYEMAQDMLKHYDSLNWQIGSILIAGVVILTGVVINKDVVEVMKNHFKIGLAIALAAPAFSGFILHVWYRCFCRQRSLYNFRNEVLHRIELQLGMYHFLRVAEANKIQDGFNDPIFDVAKSAAGYCNSKETGEAFKPLYSINLDGIPSHRLAKRLAYGIPAAQFAVLAGILVITRFV